MKGHKRSEWSYLLSAGIDFLRSAALVVVMFLVVRSFVVEAFRIPTSSMEGTLLAGDFLLVNKAAYGADLPGIGISLPALTEPSRGEVIVFRPPHEPEKHYVKRLVGLPGDTLHMSDKHLFINGDELEEPYARYLDEAGDAIHPSMGWQEEFLVDAKRGYRPSRDNWGPLVVPADHFFVLGDNRDNSEDSRYWGFVSRDSLEGKPWVVYYSTETVGEPGEPMLSRVRWSRIGGRVR